MLWKKNPPLVNCEKYYNFTKFAIQLNEIEPGTEKFVFFPIFSFYLYYNFI